MEKVLLYTIIPIDVALLNNVANLFMNSHMTFYVPKIKWKEHFFIWLTYEMLLKIQPNPALFWFQRDQWRYFFGQLLQKHNLIVQIYTWFFSLHVFLVLEKFA